MKYYLFFLLILITLSPLSSSDREIALVYQEKVWEFIEKDSDKTWELLESAFAYDNRLSGLWCARGVLLEVKNDLAGAADAYQRALIFDDWQGSDYDFFLNKYFKLLTRLGKWEKIIETRESIGFYRVNNSQVLLSSAWADYYLGNEREAAEKASRGISLYHENPDFYTLLIACGGDRRIIDSFLYYWGDKKEELFSSLYTLYKLNKLPGELEEFYILEAQDDLSRFLALKQTLLKKQGDLASLKDYLENQSLYDLDFIFELYNLTDNKGKKIIEDELLKFSHDYFTDKNGDNYKELILNRERILSIDRNRDGLFETHIEFNQGGLPQNWISNMPSGNKRDISFFSWPYVKEVKRSTPYGVQIYSFLYSQFNLEREDIVDFLYENNSFSLVGMLKALQIRDLSIPWENFINNCYLLQEYRNSILFRNYLIHGGEILGIEEDSQGDGLLDRQILMDKGEIQAARRDLDNDNKYDLFEYYEKGIWKGYAINLNGKGWSDFYHDWSVIPIKIWDFDKDHIINSYSLESLGGEIKMIKPQVSDIIKVEDLLYWENRFEAQWYR
jgi:hypothetical protein